MTTKFNYSKFRSILNFYKNRKQEYNIQIIFAQIGSGKSTDIARRCYKEIYTKKRKRYEHVYTNININLPGVEMFDPEDFKSGNFYFPPKSLILVDEVGILFSNRDYKNFPKCVHTYLALSRHYMNSFVFYSQHYNIDKSIRDLAMKLKLIRRFGSISITRDITKVIKVMDCQENGSADSQIVDSLQFDFFLCGTHLMYIPFWTNLFNSFEIDYGNKKLIPSSEYQPVLESTI